MPGPFPISQAWYNQPIPGLGQIYGSIGRAGRSIGQGAVLTGRDVVGLGSTIGRGAGYGATWGARWTAKGIYGTGRALLPPLLGAGAGAFVGRAVTDSGVGGILGAGIGAGIAMGYGPAMARGAWRGAKSLWGMRQSGGAWAGAGAALGGMIAGPAGVVPGAILGAAGGRAVAHSGWGALKGMARYGLKKPRRAGLLIGAALAIPTLAQTTHDLFSPTVKPPNFAFARPNAQYGMDPDNLSTQGLTLALHYRR